MREIKFRCWGKNIKEYLGEGEGFNMEELSRLAGQFDKWELEQYTGLKDKNGKEIYEGDIVKYLNTNYEVYFDKVQGWRGIRRGFHSVTPIGETVYNMTINRVDRPEVIGNIHENPELLEEAND